MEICAMLKLFVIFLDYQILRAARFRIFSLPHITPLGDSERYLIGPGLFTFSTHGHLRHT